jgi:hypothetical protein
VLVVLVDLVLLEDVLDGTAAYVYGDVMMSFRVCGLVNLRWWSIRTSFGWLRWLGGRCCVLVC